MIRTYSLLLLAAGVWSAAAVAAHDNPLVPLQSQAVTQVLPEGTGREVATRVCLQCHAVSDIVKRRESRHQWATIVERMAGNGASYTDAEYDALVSYLSVALGRPIKINTAPADVLAKAFDISDEQAEAIVTHRTAHGPFTDWTSVAAVPGIDPKRVEEQCVNLDFTTGR